jgi:hypothetical protein
LQRQANLPEALSMAEKAALLEPGVLSHRINVAQIMAAMGKIDEAQALARQAVAVARNEPDRRSAESLLDYIQSTRARQTDSRSHAEVRIAKPPGMPGKGAQEDEEVEAQVRALDEKMKKQRDEEQLRASLKSGPPAKLTGIIKSVKCDYPATLDIVLESGDRRHKLHAENYYQVQYGAVGGSGRTDFDPCSELESKYVEVEILRVGGQDFSGLIKSVAILK